MTSASHGQRLKDLITGKSIALEKVPLGGTLEARRLGTGGIAFYWRHTRDGKTDRWAIGTYDSSASPKSLKPSNKGYSVAAAMEAARDLALKDSQVSGGLRQQMKREKLEVEQAVKDEEARSKLSLSALCAEYVDWLKGRGKPSWSDVLNIFKNHLDGSPVAAKAASDVSKAEIVQLLRQLTETGKVTTARKLRASIRAAYSCAVKSDSDAMLPQGFAAYGVTANPVEATAAIRGRSDKNPLTLKELRQYWSGLKQVEGVIGCALRLQLLSGGQRSEQLTRIGRDAIFVDYFRLLDPKGNREEPREHLIPITPEIQLEFEKMPQTGYLFSTDGGQTAMHSTSLSTWAQEVAEINKIEDFQLKRVRSGVETVLAAARIPPHIRGQLQSHGIGGVQDRHYDAHSYLQEKLDALNTLYRLLGIHQ